ncbi:polyadenylate-binding protein 2 isoform X2 [Spinacia oleracea]|uniref:Polyadenylate-binding protein n=1 Tax=Spinacia oleracea TaxID=3562 RepID=A0A9R0HV39_SPIOL|nr:polyadenylate-binding protein 2-like isoform X2 [Spinacia oleracea]
METAAATQQQPSSPVVSGGVNLANAVATPGVFGNLSLYVGDLDGSVNESQLYDLFSQVAPIVSVRVCRDQNKRSSLGYAYVNFGSPQDAASALDVLNFTPVNGSPIRIMYSHRDPSLRKSGFANVFIKNLDSSIDNKALQDTFAAFGAILSCKVALDSNGQSRGYGFVQFDREEAAQKAINSLNGMLLNDKQVYVGSFVRRQERNGTNGSPKFTNVYVKNLSENHTDEDLMKIFSPFGAITSAVVMKDTTTGKSRCFGFVNFQSPDSAEAAVQQLNGTVHDDKPWFVGRAQRKSEREADLKAKFEQERITRYEKLQAANLYLKNLDDSINEENLNDLFSDFGTITSCKIMLNPQGVSKGSGFISFSTPEEATRALNEMNGKMIGKKPLYVAIAQRKEERKARLQAQFAQAHLQGGLTPLATGMHGFYPGSPRLSPQQLYFGQGAPGMLSPHPAGYGFQQQLLSGIRPGVAQNFMMPFPVQRQGQPGQRLGGRRGGTNALQLQQQHQTANRNGGQNFRYLANGRNGLDPSAGVGPQGLGRPLMPMTLDVSGMPVTAADVARSGPLSVPTLASALAAASPDSQRMMLGEQLYPLVERLEHDNAGKVTGMLLEMDQTEVLHLIESPDALKKKVLEAMDVLHSTTLGSEVGEQLGTMPLTE